MLFLSGLISPFRGARLCPVFGTSRSNHRTASGWRRSGLCSRPTLLRLVSDTAALQESPRCRDTAHDHKIRYAPSFQKRTATLLAALLLTTPFHTAFAWWECGHHVIAGIAFDKLYPEGRKALLDLLEHHPRFAEDFNPPDSIKDDAEAVARWRFGAAAYWPDVARKHPAWNRPNWHYQLGATLAIGAPDQLKVPESPTSLPSKATLADQELHLEQAVLLCRAAIANPTLPKPERAVALCWLLHLYGDGHQPCHAGSLYTAETFPEGDRGANSIRVKDGMSVHAIWDSLLGEKATPDEIRKHVLESAADWELMLFADKKAQSAHPSAWLREGRELAKRYVYAVEILALLPGSPKTGKGAVELPLLSDKYLEDARRIARQQAAVGGTRLYHALKNLALRLPRE